MEYFPWILSAFGIASLWMMGSRSARGPIIGLVGQALWVYYVIATGQWGLMPGVILYALVYLRNLYLYRKSK
jgi:hypothetical protein